jgi:predicted small lipoprotein YifL
MICWGRSLFAAVVIALGTLSMIGSCGQKGPLYLPEEAPADTSAKTLPTPPTSAVKPAPGSDVPRPAPAGPPSVP